MSQSVPAPSTTSSIPITTANARLLFINGVGQTVITALTIIGSSYLLYALWTQGRGKLRVRLLLGMIFGDLLLGIGAFVPNVWVLSGGRFVRDTAGCDAFGFIYTSILFSQHMYTLMIAVATFLLLKYPISPVTYWVERHSALAAPFAWTLAFAHAGAWWAHAGWATSGPLCYYAPKVIIGGLDSRDLVQFIPRAFVFLTVIVLYSMLYKFLRRPDTIQLSSQFVSGETGQVDSRGRSRRKGIISTLKRKAKRVGSCPAGQTGEAHSASKIDPNAPWEQLEFVQIGGRNPFSQTASASHFSPTASVDYQPSTQPEWRPASPPRIDTSYLTSTPEPLLGPDHRPSLVSILSNNTEQHTPVYPPDSQRASDTTLVPTPTSHLRFEPGSRSRPLNPVASQPESKSGPWRDDDIEMDLGPEVVGELSREGQDEGDDSDTTPNAQTMKEFFDDDVMSRPAGPDSRAERGTTSNNAPQMSATAYFNRQASMLMLYFPLAYMLVFSVSLIRLIYDMIHKDVNPALQIVSAWMVLSVGLIDAIVYGLAEFLIKRKVRRKMGDRL